MFSNYPDLMTIRDLQRALHIGRSAAYRLINDGGLRHLRIGRSIKIPKSYLIDFVLSSCYTENTATTLPS